MRISKLIASTILATVVCSGAALATPFNPFGSVPGQIKTTEKSYESLVQNTGDVLNGIFNVTSIDGQGGQTYSPGFVSSPPFITGVFSGFTLAQINPVSGGFQLLFTGGALNYYVSSNNLFTTQLTTLLKTTTPDVGTAELNAMALLAGGTNILSLTPQVITNSNLAHPIALPNVTLEIDLTGSSVTSFASASTQTVYLDLVGGTMANLFEHFTFTNSFTGAAADGIYQGTANTGLCISGQNEWQVCGSNNATLTRVPEPITLSLFGAGLAGVAAARRRKEKKA